MSYLPFTQQNLIWQYVYKTVDEVRTSDTAFADDSHLLFPVATNTKYAFYAHIRFLAHVTPDIKIQIVGPAGLTLAKFATWGENSNGNAYNFGLPNRSFASSISIASGSSTIPGFMNCYGIVETGATAGNIAIQWAQNSSSASPTQVNAGSYIEYAMVV